MIIVEGPDGAGKTHLVTRIENDWGITREPKAVTSTAESLLPLGTWVEEELAKGQSFRLYDRFALISSPIYSMLENPTFVWPLTEYQWLRNQFQKLKRIDPVIIWCLPPLETVRQNVIREDNSGGKILPHIDVIYHQYHAWAARDGYNTSQMVWDYTNPDLLRLANLMRFAKARTLEEFSGR